MVIRMLMVAEPVGARSNTLRLSEFCEHNIFVREWYTVFIRWDLPHPPLPVINKYIGGVSMCKAHDLVLI